MALSGYGERYLRALGWVAGILIVFAIAYMVAGLINVQELPGPIYNAHLRPAQERPCFDTMSALPRALACSLGVLFLRRPEPRPEEWWTQLIVNVEAILGPLQIALGAFAVRRRFMR